MDELDKFFELFLDSLESIDQSYFKTTYENLLSIKNFLKDRGKFNGESFERFSERPFCYELYHQIRKKIAQERCKNPDFLGETLLQGEVKKIQVEKFIERFELDCLSKEFIPDFILHKSDDADFQLFVIEVKCNPDVSKDEILADLRKINEFITNYNYKRGIFLTTNASPENLSNRLNKIKKQIDELEGIEQIKIVCKESQTSKTLIWNEDEWLIYKEY